MSPNPRPGTSLTLPELARHLAAAGIARFKSGRSVGDDDRGRRRLGAERGSRGLARALERRLGMGVL